MSNLSSIHFKKSTRFQVYHNDKIRPSYVIDSVDKVECNRPSEEARILCDEMIAKAKQRYYETSKARNKNFQATNYLQSAVVNIKESTTMDDLEKLANKLNEVYKFQCYQISIHRDEGHIAENGEKIYNHHAHMEFVTLDRDTGKSCFRLNKADLRKIQDITAEQLGMERGNPGAKRIEPRAYAQLKEQEKANTKALKQDLEQVKAENKQLKADLVTLKEVNARYEKLRQVIKEYNQGVDIYTADDYRALAKYKKEALQQAKNKQLTQEQLNNQIAQIQQSYNEKLKAKDEELKKKNEEIEKLEKDIKAQAQWHAVNSASYATQLKEKQKIINDKDDEIYNLKKSAPNSQNNSDDVKEQIKTLEKENKDLKANLETLNDNFKGYVSKVDIILEYIFEKFKISNIVELAFNWKKSQELNHAEPKQEQQLTPKADIQRNTNTQNKGRGGRW